jgi:hypothetical protein
MAYQRGLALLEIAERSCHQDDADVGELERARTRAALSALLFQANNLVLLAAEVEADPSKLDDAAFKRAIACEQKSPSPIVLHLVGLGELKPIARLVIKLAAEIKDACHCSHSLRTASYWFS